MSIKKSKSRVMVGLFPERNKFEVSKSGTERAMTTLEAVAFGAMLAWMPSLIILAASLWDVPELEGMD
jgi:hypothetical protein